MGKSFLAWWRRRRLVLCKVVWSTSYSMRRDQTQLISFLLAYAIQMVVHYWLFHNGFSVDIGDTITHQKTMAYITPPGKLKFSYSRLNHLDFKLSPLG